MSIEELTLKIAHRLTAVVQRLCGDEFETQELLSQTVAALQEALAASVKPPLSPEQLGLPGQGFQDPGKPQCARVAGFSLHGAQHVVAGDREGLERLCRYGLRAPFAQERLSLRADGRVVYQLRRPWPHPRGVTCLVLEPLDFMRRLAALIPAPYSHMVRYHGVFANRSRWRPCLPSPSAHPCTEALSAGSDSAAGEGEDTGEAPESTSQTPRRRAPLRWAQLLRRVFHLDSLKCPKCSQAMVVLALISDPPVVTKILRHLKLPTAPPPLAAPREMWEPESYQLIPPMDEHGIDERDLAGIDDDILTPPLRMSRSHPDAVVNWGDERSGVDRKSNISP